MAELSFNSFFLIGVIFFLQVELFIHLCYTTYIFYTKTLKVLNSNKISRVSFNLNINNVYIFFFFIYIIFLKSSVNLYLFLITFSLFLIYLLNKVLAFVNNYTKINTNFPSNILSLTIGLLFLLPHIKSFLVLFFFIELYSVIYYFSFLNTYSFSNQTLLKYKNGLLLLLWNNFLTTFFLAISCFFLVRFYGTTSFLELNLITTHSNIIYLYLVGLAWKLGLPIFHFFKLEIYKFLLKENVFFFSVVTTIFNLLILCFCVSQFVIFNTIYLNNLLIILSIFALNLIILNLTLSNLLYFFAISSLLTMTTVLVVFLL